MKKRSFLFVPLIIIIVVLQFLNVFVSFDYLFQDKLYQQGEKVNPNIYVIGIDSETTEYFDDAFEVWSREKTAELINLLSSNPECAPAVIALDIAFFGNKDAEIDDMLVQAVKNAGNVVLVDAATTGKDPIKGQVVVDYEECYQELKNAAFASGHANVRFDSDGAVRHSIGNLEFNGEVHQSFASAIYKTYCYKMGKEATSTFADESFYISYGGKQGAFYGETGAGCSFYKVLNGQYPVQAFKNAIVIVGAYASGMQDNYYVSIDKNDQMYGVEIHANLVNQLINGTYKRELGNIERLIPTIVLGMLLITMIYFLPRSVALGGIIACIFGYIITAYLTFQYFDVILPISAPFTEIICFAVMFFALNYAIEYFDKKRVISNYSKYMSIDVAKSIAAKNQKALSIEGTEKDIAVLFVDIRGFTSISEQNTVKDVFEMLNKYFTVTTTAIFDHKGIVDKFIGDATMALFNAPVDLPDYEYQAVCAALEMQEKIDQIRFELPSTLVGEVGFGIGINCGKAMIGNVGTEFRMEYTAIGDTVNLASRLEGKAKSGEILVSEEIFLRTCDKIHYEDKGFVEVKGKINQVHVYKAIKLKEESI